ncbi:hypothetical protein I6F37_39690, partial [Bradyrhizobium sp. NBAIM08]|nr:hypothetical protein [Bradyrhizobium sp. NBAIM08]
VRGHRTAGSAVVSALHDEMCRHGVADMLPGGIVVTGGGSIPEGMTAMAERVFQMPVRRGSPGGIDGLTGPIIAPAFATAVGLLRHAHHHPVPAPPAYRAVGAGRLFRALFSAGRMATRAS